MLRLPMLMERRTLLLLTIPEPLSRFSKFKGAGGYYFQASLQSGRRNNNTVSEEPVYSHNVFTKPLAALYPVVPCRFCKGEGEVVCDKCNGNGNLAHGGYHKRNLVTLNRIVGSKWTAMESTFGWCHFTVSSKRKGPGKDWFLEMVATCDESSRFWVNSHNLKDRERWSSGWLQKVEIMAAQGKSMTTSLLCKACKGQCKLQCKACAKSNRDGHNEPSLEIINV
ncbi:unnamed protein product [Sphagnum troendelagicum]